MFVVLLTTLRGNIYRLQLIRTTMLWKDKRQIKSCTKRRQHGNAKKYANKGNLSDRRNE